MRASTFNRFAFRSAAAVALLALAGNASGQILQGSFPIDGSQPVPPTGSSATGVGIVSLNTNTNLLTWNITFSGLSAPETVAHFHGPAAPGANAGVQLGLPLGSPKLGSATITPTQAADVAAGLWYVNIHSSAFPGGEIRGQVLVGPAVPAFGTPALIGLTILVGAAATFLLLRRRRAATGT